MINLDIFCNTGQDEIVSLLSKAQKNNVNRNMTTQEIDDSISRTSSFTNTEPDSPVVRNHFPTAHSRQLNYKNPMKNIKKAAGKIMSYVKYNK